MSLAKLEISELWVLYADTKSPEVRNEIVTRNVGLAQYVAHRYRARVPEHQSIEDIVSYAYEGLIDAVEKYDALLGFQFPTYAVRRISGSILDGLRREDPLPRSARKKVKDYESVVINLWEVLGREPTDAELAQSLHMSESALGHIQRDSYSQNKFIGDQEMPITHDTRHDDPELATEMAELAEHLADKISKMPDDERAFVLAHYGQGLTLTELSGILEVSENRLTQIRRSVLEAVTANQ